MRIPSLRVVVTACVTVGACLLGPRDGHAMGFRMLTGDSGTVKARSVDFGTEADCPQTAFALSFMSARNVDLQAFLTLGYRSVDTRELLLPGAKSFTYLDVAMGLRYFPRNPTIWIGDVIALRATAAASLGVDVLNLDLPVNLTGGIAISGTKAAGLMFEGLYRPTPAKTSYYDDLANERSVELDPFYGARLTLFF